MPKPNVREQIVSAGLEVLHRHGFNGSGVQDITDAARVPKGSFYNHFDSKEALGAAALDRYWQVALYRLQILRDESIAPVERLRRYFDSLGETMARWNYQKGCLIGNFSTELADQSELVRGRLAVMLAEWTRALEACISEAQRNGDIDAEPEAGVLAAFLLNAWEGTVLRAKVDKNDTAIRQFMTSVFGRILASTRE